MMVVRFPVDDEHLEPNMSSDKRGSDNNSNSNKGNTTRNFSGWVDTIYMA